MCYFSRFPLQMVVKNLMCTTQFATKLLCWAFAIGMCCPIHDNVLEYLMLWNLEEDYQMLFGTW